MWQDIANVLLAACGAADPLQAGLGGVAALVVRTLLVRLGVRVVVDRSIPFGLLSNSRKPRRVKSPQSV